MRPKTNPCDVTIQLLFRYLYTQCQHNDVHHVVQSSINFALTCHTNRLRAVLMDIWMAGNVSLLSKVRINICGRYTDQSNFHVQTPGEIYTCWSIAAQSLHTVSHGRFTQLPHTATNTWNCLSALHMWKFLKQHMARTSIF